MHKMNSHARKTIPSVHLFVDFAPPRTLLKKGDFYSYLYDRVSKSSPFCPYIVKLYAKIFSSMSACPFSSHKKFSLSFPAFAYFLCLLRFFHKKGSPLPPGTKSPLLISVLFFPQALSKASPLYGLQTAKAHVFLPISPKEPPTAHNTPLPAP